ncbi:DUF1902 domain-containing protein [Pelagibacterium luteolum]|uniref:DUF1902 domain-containing protein n=1 Tax=Pelagibacterium luteolum TaxID=440168 RepID=A0A1G7TMP2_9HYPH|nr:DUF1902 domain-containing protein [Pelagibacterium luteolum]SDG36613.1 protein of unknown function [Pelagibacterium luteolum]
MHSIIVVRADWDDEAGVWVATSSDIDGLALEAASVDALYDKVANALPDLLELNNNGDFDLGHDVPFHMVAAKTGRIPALQH